MPGLGFCGSLFTTGCLRVCCTCQVNSRFDSLLTSSGLTACVAPLASGELVLICTGVSHRRLALHKNTWGEGYNPSLHVPRGLHSDLKEQLRALVGNIMHAFSKLLLMASLGVSCSPCHLACRMCGRDGMCNGLNQPWGP